MLQLFSTDWQIQPTRCRPIGQADSVEIEPFVRSHDKIVHRAVLRQQGISAYRVRRAIESKDVFRVGRHRVAVNGCNPQLLRAVQLGGQLTCVSAALYRELWTKDDGRLHVAVSPAFSGQSADGETPTPLLHWGRGLAPTHVTDTIVSVINMLSHIALCQPPELAVAIFDSALNKGVIARQELIQLSRAAGGRMQRVVDLCTAGADSGIETLIRVRLGWRGIAMRIQVSIDGHPADGLIGEWLVIQADGYGPHSGSPQRSKDLKQDARLLLQGYTVLRFSYAQILYEWEYVEEEILAAMAQRLHLRPRR
ncbi:MAG: DUF559 domain-containing protein [Microbacteriaceae bacterium]|nr:MAG: DUF559 domain-containing protein [Microbacteriaceae bacterium]